MKKIKIGIFLFIALMVFSCSENELSYSCNPDINNYVLHNLDALKSVKIEEFSTFDDELQKAVYRSYSPAKKYEVWTDKLAFVATDKHFNIAEKEHIRSLSEYLQPELFDETNTIMFSAFTEFFLEWENNAYNNLGWDKSMVSFVSSSLCLYYDDFILNSSFTKSVQTRGVDCDCNTTADACSSGRTCQDAICSNDSDIGCGTLWLQPCNGKCSD